MGRYTSTAAGAHTFAGASTDKHLQIFLLGAVDDDSSAYNKSSSNCVWLVKRQFRCEWLPR